MSQELHYTSAPRGVWPGSQGYCTVACTKGMPHTLAERLEGLSAYRVIFPPHDPRAARNPVALSHLRVMVAGRPSQVLSRIGFAGLDYTNRTNKYAHHVVLEPSELPHGGPAWLLSQPGFLRESWDGHVRFLDEARPVPQGDQPPGVCQAWQAATGDAGWAGVLAEAFLSDAKAIAFLVFEPGMDLLPLILEAQSLIPPERRWDLTFSTYCTTLPQGVVCAWRGVVRGSPEELEARRLPKVLILDLDQPFGEAEGGPLVEQARTGLRIATANSVARPSVRPENVPVSLLAGSELPPPSALLPDEIYAAIPTLPTPPVTPKPPPVRPTVDPSRPQRARAIVAAACVAILVTGGIVASRLIIAWDSDGAAALPAPAQADVPGGEHEFGRDKIDTPNPPRGASRTPVPAGAAPTVGPAPAGPPAAHSVAPGDQGGPRAFDPVGAALDVTQNNQRAASQQGKVNDEPKTTRERPSNDLLRSYVYLTNGLPHLFPPEGKKTIYSKLQGVDEPNLMLIGSKDRGYEEFKISQKPGLTTGSLDVSWGEPPKRLARFSVTRQELSFEWMESEGDANKVRSALQCCVVMISDGKSNAGATQTTYVVLRPSPPTEKAIELHVMTNSYSINDWKSGNEPYRALEIGDCSLSHGGKKSLLRQVKPSVKPEDAAARRHAVEREVGFRTEDLPDFCIWFTRNTDHTYFTEYKCAFIEGEKKDSINHRIADLARKLGLAKLNLAKNDLSALQIQPKGSIELEAHRKAMSKVQARLNEAIHDTDLRIQATIGELEQTQDAQHRRLLESTRQNLESHRVSLVTIVVDVDRIKVELKPIESMVVDLKKDGEISFTLTMNVDGNPIVVARVGRRDNTAMDNHQVLSEKKK